MNLQKLVVYKLPVSATCRNQARNPESRWRGQGKTGLRLLSSRGTFANRCSRMPQWSWEKFRLWEDARHRQLFHERVLPPFKKIKIGEGRFLGSRGITGVFVGQIRSLLWLFGSPSPPPLCLLLSWLVSFSGSGLCGLFAAVFNAGDDGLSEVVRIVLRLLQTVGVFREIIEGAPLQAQRLKRWAPRTIASFLSAPIVGHVDDGNFHLVHLA